MRIAQEITLAIAIAAQVVLASGCMGPVSATVTRAPTTPLKANPAIYLQAVRQMPRVAESLRTVGVQLTESFSEADYILNVKVGGGRGSRGCGSINNVAYILDGGGRHLMVIKARGSTGECTPNVFDDVSQKLATFFGG
jgi:hypothetical protein